MIDVTRPVQLLDGTGPAEINLSNESSGYQISNLISDININRSLATSGVGR